MNCIPNRLVYLTLVISSNLTANIINVPADSATIQSAINGAVNGDTVLVQPGTYPENIIWPDVNGIKLLSAGDSSDTIIDGGGNGSVIYMIGSPVPIDSTTEIRGFKITNGRGVYRGGGLFIGSASPVLARLWVAGNTAEDGGGLHILNSSPTLTDVIVIGNTAISADGIYAGKGGGIYIANSSPTLMDVTVTGNTASHGGGGIYILEGNPTLSNMTLTSNAASSGGGLYIVGSSPTLTDVTVTDNTAVWSGGGIYMEGGSPTLTHVTVTGNTVGSGGGIYIAGGSPTLADVTVTGNTASWGGGFHIGNSSPTLTGGTVSGNTATNDGGGLYISYLSSPTLAGVTVSGNTASTGGGLYIGGDSGALVRNVTITGNTGGIYIESGSLSIAGSNIAYNGTGLYNLDNSHTIDADSVWWGDSTGPYHLQDNPGGLGDSVNTYVDITPFLTIPDTAAPPIPVQNLVVISQEDDMIQLAWDASPMGDLAGYKFYYDTDSTGFPYADTVDVGTDTIYTLSGFPLGTIFYVAVTCYDTDGNESWYSKEINTAPKDITAPAAPQNLTVVAANESVTLTWDQNTEVDFLRYRIYGGTSLNPSSQIDSTTSIADTSKTIVGLSNGITYYYRVTAVDTALNESAYSNEGNAIPFNTPPEAFALLSPGHESTLVITNTNLGDTLTFAWEWALDVNGDTVRYGVELTDGLGAIVAFGDTTATEVRLPYAEVVTIMESVGQVTITGTWDIFAADGEDSTWASNGPFTFTIDATTLDVLRQALLPQQFALRQNYPNPFNPSTTIRFDLPEATEVHLAVYDLLGREVARLAEGQLEAGYHQQVWNGRDYNGNEVPTGIYFVLVVTPEFRESIKTVLLK